MPLLKHQRNRLIVLVAGLVLGGVAFLIWLGVLPGLRDETPVGPIGPSPFTLEVWNVFEEEEVYSEFIREFGAINPHIKINYTKINYLEYRQRLTDAFANGTAPDIFAMHSSWLPLHEHRIYPAPATLSTVTEFDQIYPPVVAFDFTRDTETGQKVVYAFPLFIETLGIFYNKDYFETANISSPPKTWEELLDYAKVFTQFDDAGEIRISGIPLGTADNINRSTDIVTLLMLQSGTRMNNKLLTEATFDESVSVGEGEEEQRFYPGKEALDFYLAFSDPTRSVYSWNDEMSYSIDAFVEGKAAMMISYPHLIPTIMSKAPHLNLGVAAVPQLKGRKEDVNYANYWGFTVSKGSRNGDAAWEFIEFLVQPENVKRYLEDSRLPTARRDLILWQQQDSQLKHFANQIMAARSWYQGDSFAVESILSDMITSAETGELTVEEALEDASTRVTVTIKKVQE